MRPSRSAGLEAPPSTVSMALFSGQLAGGAARAHAQPSLQAHSPAQLRPAAAKRCSAFGAACNGLLLGCPACGRLAGLPLACSAGAACTETKPQLDVCALRLTFFSRPASCCSASCSAAGWLGGPLICLPLLRFACSLHCASTLEPTPTCQPCKALLAHLGGSCRGSGTGGHQAGFKGRSGNRRAAAVSSADGGFTSCAPWLVQQYTPGLGVCPEPGGAAGSICSTTGCWAVP